VAIAVEAPERYVAARRNLPVMDRNLMPRILERPGDPVRLGAIGRVETDEEFLSHWSAFTEWDCRIILISAYLINIRDKAWRAQFISAAQNPKTDKLVDEEEDILQLLSKQNETLEDVFKPYLDLSKAGLKSYWP
jgi:hypothetical protein